MSGSAEFTIGSRLDDGVRLDLAKDEVRDLPPAELELPA
jgi:hypothetical protein